MAGLDSIKHFADGGDVEAAPVSEGAIQTTAPKSTGIAGKIALDPTQTEAILTNMQKYIDERQGFMPSLATGLSRGMATAYGPSSLAAFDQQQNLQDKQIMDYRSQMAAYRAAQSQAANEAERYKGMTPTTGGAQAAPGEVPISPEQMAIEKSLGTYAEKLESRRKYLSTKNTEAIKLENAPGMRDIVDIYVPGQGNVQMLKSQAEKLLNINPNLQAIVNGNKVPAAQAIAATSAATTPTTGIPTFTDPSIKVVSAKRTPEKGQELWDASVKNGTPGIQPNGLPVAKPGTSSHETQPEGDVLDLNSKALTKSGRLELAQKGYYQPLGLDSPHWEKIPTTSAKAEVAVSKPTVAAQPAQPNETRAEYERRIKSIGEIESSRIKEGETKRGEVLQARESSIETGNAIGRIENLLNTPEGNRAVGVFNKPGVVSAFGKILSEGVQAGNFGAVSFKGLEDAVRAAGGDQKTIDAAQSLARDFAQMQLNIAKRDLKGQGAVSDNERAIVAKVTGSTANSPEVLKDFTRWNRVRNTFDKQVGDALQNWEKTNPNQSYTKFKESDVYKQLENDYIAKTDAMAAKMSLSGKKAAPSDTGDKTKEYLKQYGPKKES
jgi:hypothetical protein